MKDQSVKPLALALLMGLAAALIILLAAAWAVSSGILKDMQTPAVAAIFVGSLITAMGAAAFFRQRYLIVGVGAALAFFLTVFLLGGLIYFRIAPSSPVVSMLLASLAAGVLAAILPRKKKVKRG